jgi:hypothetical protein
VTRDVVEDEDVISAQHVMKRGHAAIQAANQRAPCQIANTDMLLPRCADAALVAAAAAKGIPLELDP